MTPDQANQNPQNTAEQPTASQTNECVGETQDKKGKTKKLAYFVVSKLRDLVAPFSHLDGVTLATFVLAYIAFQTDRTLHDTLVSSNRAWVGPHQASFDKEPIAGKPVIITLQYQNTGREPARNFAWAMNVFNATVKDVEGRIVDERLAKDLNECRQWKASKAGSVIYPIATGFGAGYILTREIEPKIIDDDVAKGNKFVVMDGCFGYLTYDIFRHSYFCYFYP